MQHGGLFVAPWKISHPQQRLAQRGIFWKPGSLVGLLLSARIFGVF